MANDVDRFAVLQGVFTPNLSVVRRTHFSDFRVGFNINNLRAWRCCFGVDFLNENKTDSKHSNVCTCAVGSQQHSCQIWSYDISNRSRKRRLSKFIISAGPVLKIYLGMQLVPPNIQVTTKYPTQYTGDHQVWRVNSALGPRNPLPNIEAIALFNQDILLVDISRIFHFISYLVGPGRSE